jgi:hypothetical protein
MLFALFSLMPFQVQKIRIIILGALCILKIVVFVVVQFFKITHKTFPLYFFADEKLMLLFDLDISVLVIKKFEKILVCC